MIITGIKLTGKKWPQRILLGADWHTGTKACSYDGIERFLEVAQTMPWVLLGDAMETISPNDKRFNMGQHETPLLNQMDNCSDLIAKANKTCIGLIVGNHEWKESGKVGNITKKLASQANVPYLDACCYGRVACAKGNSTFHFAHGTGSANYKAGEPDRKEINKQVKIRQENHRFHADLIATGHKHTCIVSTPILERKLCLVGKTVRRRPVTTRPGWHCVVPAMFKTYPETNPGNKKHVPSYAEMGHYDPNDMGWLAVVYDRDATISAIEQYDHEGNQIKVFQPKVID